MEYSPELMERIYAAHLGQKYIADYAGEEPFTFTINGETITSLEQFPNLTHKDRIILTPLSEISDEDAIAVAKLYPWFNWYGDTVLEVYVNQFGEKVVSNEKRIGKYETVCLHYKEPSEIELNQKQTDYLRSKGYDCGYGDIPSLIGAGIAIEKAK